MTYNTSADLRPVAITCARGGLGDEATAKILTSYESSLGLDRVITQKKIYSARNKPRSQQMESHFKDVKSKGRFGFDKCCTDICNVLDTYYTY